MFADSAPCNSPSSAEPHTCRDMHLPCALSRLCTLQRLKPCMVSHLNSPSQDAHAVRALLCISILQQHEQCRAAHLPQPKLSKERHDALPDST